MASCRCKMCGGQINYANNQTTATCEFCGTEQTIVCTDDTKKLNLYNRANSLRLSNDFDKAMTTYESILIDNPKDAEAHWGICLCRYGIEYVDDPKTRKKIPTCHRTIYNSIFDDIDYKEAIDNCDVLAKKIYQLEAEEIDKIQKSILSISQKEEPFDIFICYKETDENGKRTKDSVIAQDIYEALIEKGYKVFFSRITLESKLGTQYEPIIFAALQSAKVMLAIGSKPEYYNSPWVKNEWSRFLSFMKEERGKYLIPCYKDMEAYDMPDEFLSLQAQNIDNLGFLQDLIRGIDKIFDKKINEKEIQINVDSNNSKYLNLLKRAKLSIEDRDYKKASALIEDVLNENAECAEAYVALMLIDLQLTKEEDLLNITEIIDQNKNYLKALRFADENYKNKLLAYSEQIKKNIELKNKEQIYLSAKSLIDLQKFYKAKELLKAIKDYKDSDDLINYCNEQIKSSVYMNAQMLIKTRKFKEAIDALQSIENYKDSNDLINYCNEQIKSNTYLNAQILIKLGRLKEAINVFQSIENYKDSNDLINYCNEQIKEDIYNKAIDLIKLTNYDAACLELNNIIEYRDSKELIEKCKQLKKEKRLEEEKVALLKKERAEQIKLKRINYGKIIKDRFKRCFIIIVPLLVLIIILVLIFNLFIPSKKYNNALDLINTGQYLEAEMVLNELGNFKDSKKQVQLLSCREYFDNGDYETGINVFYNVGGIIKIHYYASINDHIIKTNTMNLRKNTNKEEKDDKIPQYDTIGWLFQSYAFTKAQTIEIIFIAIDYKISLNLNGGVLVDYPVSYNICSERIEIKDPEKKGYTFNGWKTNDNGLVKKIIINNGSTGNRDFTATWEVKICTIEYNLNITNSINDYKYYYIRYGNYYELMTPKREGYEFLGWHDKNGNLYSNVGFYNYDDKITLIAYWKLNKL